MAPILERYGFGATFFVTHRWMEDDPELFLTFPELKELSDRGFEIGNHTWDHSGYHVPEATRLLPPSLEKMESTLAEFGIPKPVSFAWPGGAFGPEGRAVLIEHGYLFGRRVIHPEFPLGSTLEGPVYDPTVNDPFLIPTYGLMGDGWSLDHFSTVVSKSRGGRAVVLCFHGVPDQLNPDLSVSPARFEQFMLHLARGGYRGIAMRDLAKWVDPAARPLDPLVGRRCPE